MLLPPNIPRNYDDNWTPRYFYILSTCLLVALITTNIVAFKFFQIFGMKFGAGTLMFPVCLIVGDLMTEVYGFRRSRRVILLCLGCFFAYTLVAQLAIALPPAPEWKDQEAFQTVFGQSPRLFVAGTLAYLTGELTNSLVISRMKIYSDGRYFWGRATVSAVIAELSNTTVFMVVAWLGSMDIGFLLGVIVNGTVLKVIIQTCVLPITTYLAVKLKILEGVDHFDGHRKSKTIPV